MGRKMGLVVVAGMAWGMSGAARVWGDVVYVTDTSTNAGTVVRIADGGGAASTLASGLTRPEGIAFVPSGALYVDNQLSGEIDRVGAGGGWTPFVTIDGGFVGGMISDGLGNLYVSRQHEGTIDKVTPGGVVTVYASGVGSPQGLVFNKAGAMFVGSPDGKVYKVAAGGGVGALFASVPTAVGVAVNTAGEVFAGDAADGYIERFSATGVDLGQYAAVSNPAGMLFDSSGRLLVSSTTSSAVGSVVYAVAPGGDTPTVYASGLNGPFYLAIQTVAGDANGDGKVDLNDLNIVLNHLGLVDSSRADGNFDGAATIDLNDLNQVLNNLGSTGGPTVVVGNAEAAAVPEAGNLWGLMMAGVMVWRRGGARVVGG